MTTSTQVRRLMMFLMILGAFALAGCGADDDDDDNDDDDTVDDDDDDDDNDDNDTTDDDDVPDDIITPPDDLPFTISRDPEGEPLTDGEIAAFTAKMKAFYEGIDFFRWAVRHSFGLAQDNQWGQPPYMIWWTNTYAVKDGDLVTFTFENSPDNTTAQVTRVLANAIAYYLMTGDATARELVLGYINGLLATYDGMVWANEDPPVNWLMARTIFNRSHAYTLDGGRQAYADYEPVRIEEEARRHDTWQNPENPTWGDIYVRNKRSKDDFPYLYRDVPPLARLIHETDDEELREAAIALYRRIGAMTRDIVNHDYVIRTKVEDGEIFIPRTEWGIVDDFASFKSWDWIFPNAECTAKLGTAYLAYGNALDNACGDGDGGLYEFISIWDKFWGSNMIWGYHVSAVSLALAFGDNQAAWGLLNGFADRMDSLMDHPLASKYFEWYHDVAALAVLGAAYGLPLTDREARLVEEKFSAAVDYYNAFSPWDLWDAGVPDGEYIYIPDRYTYDDEGNAIDYHIRINEIVNLFEYCQSPLKDPAGARFVDCDALIAGD